MNVKHLQTLQQVADFLHGSGAFEPSSATQSERYQWIDKILSHFRYDSRSKADKGLLHPYLCRISGYSRQQVTRLVRRYREQGVLKWSVRPVKGFVSRYTKEDVQLLAEVDALLAQKITALYLRHFIVDTSLGQRSSDHKNQDQSCHRKYQIHHLHVWSICSHITALCAHIDIEPDYCLRQGKIVGTLK